MMVEEKKKIKMGTSATLIVGLILTGLGGLFIAAGLGIGAAAAATMDFPYPLLAFTGTGFLFLIPGVILLCRRSGRRKQLQAVVDAGRYFFAEVVEIETCYNITVNGRHPQKLVARMTDPYGNVHVFKSMGMRLTCAAELIGKQVKIYADQNDLDNYYMDVEPLLGTIHVH